MAIIRIYSEDNDTTYTVNADVFSSVLDDGLGDIDYYLKITTTIRKIDNSAFPEFRVKTLTDVAPGVVSPAANFSALIDGYVAYFISEAEVIYSSSSSSSSSSESSDGYSESSSSSSYGYSSESSSSSTAGYSSSSSSSSQSV